MNDANGGGWGYASVDGTENRLRYQGLNYWAQVSSPKDEQWIIAVLPYVWHNKLAPKVETTLGLNEKNSQKDEIEASKARSIALLAIEGHCASILTGLDQHAQNGFVVGKTVGLRKPNWEGLAAFSTKWVGTYIVKRIARLRCWIEDKSGRITREGIPVCCLKPYFAR